MAKRHGPTWSPGATDYAQVLSEQNPWRASGTVPAALAQDVERPLGARLAARLQHNEPRRFQLILGPRRVGKTTCLYQAVRHLLHEGVDPRRIVWLRLDHPLFIDNGPDLGDLTRSVLANAPPGDGPCYLFLDELTYADRWDQWLKTFYDEQWPVQIAGSSSSTAALKGGRTESGVGRWEEQYLAPYLFSEFLDLVGAPATIPVAENLAGTLDACIEQRIQLDDLTALRRRFILTGGFPELLMEVRNSTDVDEEAILLRSQRTLKDDAVERAIYKDIPQAFAIDNPMRLERVLYTLAGQITGVLSPTNICQSLGLAQPTFDRYLSYLTQAYLVFTLQNYSASEEPRQRRGRKLYFVDGAVRNAALQRGIAPLSDPSEMGLLMENLVAGHLHALSQQSQVRLYHWRDGRDEVDLIYDHPNDPIAFEISSSVRHKRTAIMRFRERFPKFKNRCYLVAPQAEVSRPDQNPDGIGTLPLDLLLVAIGRQAERFLELRLM